MTHISKSTIDEKEANKINKLLISILSNLKTKNTTEKFMNEFFTHSEQVMFAKRLAIIFLLAQGISQYKICKMLKVSSSTTGNLNSQLRLGQFETIERFIKNKKNRPVVNKQMIALGLILTSAEMSENLYKAMGVLRGKEY